jgi:dTDP-4-dehydrorhamnose 3,5-epimerase
VHDLLRRHEPDPAKRLRVIVGMRLNGWKFPRRHCILLKMNRRESAMPFRDGRIDGVIWKTLTKFRDPRGWLCELFRHDEVPAEFHPVMAYISLTETGVARGPHEHVEQADFFCFIGPSNFRIYLWDNRRQSPTFMNREVRTAGADAPAALIVPPGVVHAYKNVGGEPGLVFNCPNRLYKGPGRKEPVDEIRHEEQAGSVYTLD